MTDELVKRLREQDEYNKRHYERDPLHEEAAARIEQLTEERDRLREALTFYAAPETYQDTFVAEDCECCHRREHPAIEDDNGKVARAALKGESHE